MANVYKRAGVSVVGFLVVGTGIVLMPLPGPGLVIVVAGLTILATEYAWARRALSLTRDRARQAARASAANPWSTAASIACGVGLVALGVLYLVFEWDIPFMTTIAAYGVMIGGIILVTSVLVQLNMQRQVAKPSSRVE